MSESWTPTAELRFLIRVLETGFSDSHYPTKRKTTVLQQKWTRQVIEHRPIMGSLRRIKSYQHEWRDVPTETE